MTPDSSKVPPESYFEERDAMALLVPRAKMLAALADALGTVPAGDTVTIPRVPTAALLRPFIACPEGELPEAWEAMVRVAAVMNLRASQPQGDQDADLGKAIDERDTAEGWADGLAVQIGKYFGRDIGEHSSGHCPWQEAKDILEEAAPYKPAAAVEPADEREAFETWAKAKSDWNSNLERKGDGYAGAFAQEAWNGWLARAVAPALEASAAPVVPDGFALVPLRRLKNARALVDRGFWTEGSKILDELIAATPALAAAPQAPAAPALDAQAPPAIKGAWISGGYVVVTPAGTGQAKAVKAAILATLPVAPAAAQATAN